MNELYKDCWNTKEYAYKLRYIVDALVKENFGRCPDTQHFNDILDKMRDAEAFLKCDDYLSWEKYMDDFYGGNR
jgi:hypothetical protein